MQRLVMVLTAALFAASCAGTPVPLLEEAEMPVRWVAVAALSGNDAIAQAHALHLLECEGIPSGSEGSVMYSLSVPERHEARARRALRAGHRPGVFVVSGPLSELGGTLFLCAPVPSDDRFQDLDPLEPGSSPAGLAVDRVVQHTVEDSVWRSFPNLENARAAPCTYMGPGGKDATAWNILLRWSDGGEGWMELRYLVVGHDIRKQGGVGAGGRSTQSSR